MRIFALAQDLALDTNKFYRQYLDAGDPQHLPLERLYLDVGDRQETKGHPLCST